MCHKKQIASGETGQLRGLRVSNRRNALGIHDWMLNWRGLGNAIAPELRQGNECLEELVAHLLLGLLLSLLLHRDVEAENAHESVVVGGCTRVHIYKDTG